MSHRSHEIPPAAGGPTMPPPVLRLPVDSLDAAADQGGAGCAAIELAPGVESRLRTVAERAGCGLFAVLAAGVAALLYRYGAGEEMVAASSSCGGVDGGGRPRLLRFGMAAADTFDALARRAEQACRETDPGSLSRAGGWAPAQVAVELDFGHGRAEAGAITGQLVFLWQRGAGGLRGDLLYRTALFAPETAARLARHLSTILTAAARHPERPIAGIDLLDPAERGLLLGDWAGTPSAPAPHDTLTAWFEAGAARWPDAVAVADGVRTTTYAQLQERSLQLARRLRANGIGPEDRVAVCMERSLELVVAIVGTLRAGAACVCLDPDDPEARLKLILEDSRARLLLLLRRDVDAPVAGGVPALFIGETGDDPVPGAAASVPPLPLGENLAFVFYTTGSTGRPKGVMITHRGRCDRLAWELDAYRAALGGGVLLKTSVSFARVVKETFWALLSGGAVVVAPPGAQRDPERIAALVQQHGVRLTIFVPSQIEALLDSEGMKSAAGALRLVLAEGEPLPRELEARWRERFAAPLWNAYGLTEVSTVAVWSGGRPGARRLVPSGRPAAVRVYLLDERMRLVPPGAPGEVYVGGPGVFRGYLGQPGQTAARLVPDPFSGVPGARLFRTGDLALWHGGTLASLGRNDAQTKLHGFRVEPAEVEAALATHPAVRQAVAMVREDAPGERRLVAYAVPRADAAPAEGELRQFLRGRLPPYLVPARCVVLDALPLTPNGKVDRTRLPPPRAARPLPDEGYQPPRDPVERFLAATWEQLMGVSGVGIRDDFFALGGTSLLAGRLAGHVERELGVRLPLAALLEASTVERLARVIGDGAGHAPWSPLVCLSEGGDGVPFFCVHGLFGNVLCFRELAGCLGTGHPVYALQSQALDPVHPPLTRVEEMAACYLREVRAVQPGGPYLLGGYSFGGMVAFEMAQQLAAAGERVALLAMIDAAAPAVHRGIPPFEHTVYVRAALGPAQGEARWRTLAVDRVVDDGPGSLPAWWTLRSHVDDPRGRHLRVERATRAATRAYRPRPYAGRIDLVRGMNQRSRLSLEPWAGWGPLATGGLRVHDVPGDHVTLLSRPWVESLASVLRGLIAGALTPPRPTAPR